MKYIAALALIGAANAAAADCPDKLKLEVFTDNTCGTAETDDAKKTAAATAAKSWSAGAVAFKECTEVKDASDAVTGYTKITCDDAKKMTVAIFDTSKTDCSQAAKASSEWTYDGTVCNKVGSAGVKLTVDTTPSADAGSALMATAAAVLALAATQF